MVRPPRIDIAVAAAIVVLGQLEIWLAPDPPGSRPLLALAALAATLPLAWRSTNTAIACGIAFAALLAPNDLDAIYPLFVLILAGYSLGVHVTGWKVLLPLAIALPTLLIALFEEANQDAAELLQNGSFIFAFILAPFVAGRIVRHRTARAAAAEARAATAAADERARIARELHDVVGHCLSVIVVQAGTERRLTKDMPETTAGTLDVVEQTARQALAEMRRLLDMLRRDDDELLLGPQPSLRHVDDLLDGVRAAGLPVELVVEGVPAELPPGVDLSAYRIVQEALTNALKHAGPASARVRIRYGADRVDVEVSDDGRGPAHAAPPAGHGLVNMRERALVYGGSLETGPRADGGYEVRVTLPLGAAA